MDTHIATQWEVRNRPEKNDGRKRNKRAGEAAQWLRALVALAGDTAPTGWLTTFCHSSSRDLMASSDLCKHGHTCGACTYYRQAKRSYT